jgi:glycosyltransferase involved in cell wall biosynthesis
LLVAGDADRFAADVVRVLRDPGLAIDLAIRGRRLVEARYTWEGSVAALEDVYDAVVAERG